MKQVYVHQLSETLMALWRQLWTRRARAYYIGGSDVLPPPLAAPEEAAAIAAMRQGDKAARDRLIAHNLRLVVYIARKFDNTGINIEDLISNGTIGLIKAIGTFDPGKKIKLATYASRCIENEILMFLRRSGKAHREVSLDEPLSTDWDGNELHLGDIMGTDPDMVCADLEEQSDRDALRAAVQRLPGRERNIIEMRFGFDGRGERTQKEVADALGISQSYISRLEKRIIRRLHADVHAHFNG